MDSLGLQHEFCGLDKDLDRVVHLICFTMIMIFFNLIRTTYAQQAMI